MKGIAVFLAGLGAIAIATAAPANRAETELRVYLLDKETGQPVRDIENFRCTVEIEGRDGVKKQVAMQSVGESKKGPGVGPSVTGYAKEMDRWIVDLFVLPGGGGRVGDLKKEVQEFNIAHGGPYWKGTLDPEFARDGMLRFNASCRFEIEGDEHSVRGFEYPHGLYSSVIDSIIDHDLERIQDGIGDGKVPGDAGKKILQRLEGLPPLAFADPNKQDFERARQDAVSAVRALDNIQLGANGGAKDAAEKTIDDAETKLKRLRDVSKDATGVKLGAKMERGQDRK